MRKRILITGGSGFVGRNLVELLADRYEVSAPGRAELDLLEASAVHRYLETGRFDTVIHAATGRSNRKTTAPGLFQNNIRMFFNFARNSHLYRRMLHFGSGAEFDRRAYRPLMPESYFDASVPEDDYGFAKYVCAKYTELAPNIVNLRLFGVFGKYEDWEVRFLSNVCCRLVHGLPVTVRQNVRFDYLDIRDLAPITTWFIENHPVHHTYNVCTGDPVEILALARTIAAGTEIHIVNSGMGTEYSGSNERLLAEIGPFPFRSKKESLQDLYSWYESRKFEIDPELLRFDG
ncbi:MAG: NAD(P)-dependent oxidoreductase [Acidobacteriota bacterium]|nr:NAD(P)-dependent oxidoreductase [Acidobacteriota bacterium]